MTARSWFLLAFLLAAAPASPFQEEEEDRIAGVEEPRISLSRLGPAELEGAPRVELEEATVDLAGEVWNHGPDDEIVALFRRLGQSEWTVAAASPSEPGGLFQISAVRFPEVGDYELVAGLFPARELTAGKQVSERTWRERARTVSRRLPVRILASPPAALDAGRPDLTILTVGGAGVDPATVTPVPARGEVVLRADGFPRGTRIYLAILAPYSDRGLLVGPARRDLQTGRFVLQGVSLEIPGDPRHAHLELIAVASAEPLAPGPLSLRTFRRRDLRTSPTVNVMVDEKWSAAQSRRVPYLAITRIGGHLLSPSEPPARPLPVEPGDLVEVGHFERIPEGARVWILSRPRGSRLWLAQGPALLRGAVAPEDPLLGPPEATWVWPGARFEHPEESREPARPRGGSEEFEILAVLSTATLPGAWIDSSALSSAFLQTVSPLVAVRVRPPEPRPEIDLAISRIGGEEVDPGSEMPVAASEQIEVAAREALAPSQRIYVARHALGDSLWTLSEAIPRGRTHVVPSLSFTNPHARDGARYQLIAVVTSGLLPAEQLEYDDLLRVSLASSEVVTARYERGGLVPRIERWWRPSEEGDEEPPVKGGSGMSWMWIVLLGSVVLLAVLIALEWGLGIISALAKALADSIGLFLRWVRAWLGPPAALDSRTFFFGLFLLVLMISVIIKYYLPLYSKAIAEVTRLSPQESGGWAVWLVMLTALAGTFLELSSDSAVWISRRDEAPAASHHLPLRVFLTVILILAILFLMFFQAFFYYTFMRKTVGGIVPGLGGVAFFLIAFVEAIAFYFITRLTLVPAGNLLPWLLLVPVILLYLACRFIEKLFGSFPKRKAKP